MVEQLIADRRLTKEEEAACEVDTPVDDDNADDGADNWELLSEVEEAEVGAPLPYDMSESKSILSSKIRA